MKSKIFKKLIAGAATLAMVAQFGFVLPASAADLTLGAGTESDPYISYDFSGDTVESKVWGYTSSAKNTTGVASTDEWLTYYVGSSNRNGGNIAVKDDGGTGYENYAAAFAGQFADADTDNSREPSIKINKVPEISSIPSGQVLVYQFDFRTTNANGAIYLNDDTDKLAGDFIKIALTNCPTNTWLTAVLTIDSSQKQCVAEIYNQETSVDVQTNTYTTTASPARFRFLGGSAVNNSCTYSIDNIKVYAKVPEVSYTISYSIEGKVTSEIVKGGNKVAKVPDTAVESKIFDGWYKGDDRTTLYSDDQLKAMEITENITFTAAYHDDPDYIHQIASVTFTKKKDGAITQPAEGATDTYDYEVQVLSTVGKDLTADCTYEWTIVGNEADDNYTKLEQSSSKLSASTLSVKNGVSNYFGYIKVVATYDPANSNEETDNTTGEQTTPYAILGETVSGNIIPAAGYPENFSQYADTIVGYKATADGLTTKDLLLNNWSIYGSNPARDLLLVQYEDGTKGLQFASTGGNRGGNGSSTVGVYQWTAQTKQYTIDTLIKLPSGASVGVYSNTPNNTNASAECVASMGSDSLTIGSGENTATISGVTANTWVRLILSCDPVSKQSYAKVYDETGTTLIGESEVVTLASTESMKYLTLYGAYPIDVKSFRAYNPVASAITIAGDETVKVPETEGTTSTAILSANCVDKDGNKILTAATWSLAEEYANVELVGSGQTATLKVSPDASGVVVVNATIGGVTAQKEISLTTSSNTVSLKGSSSVTIPFEGEADVKATYTAQTLDKDTNPVPNDVITYSFLRKDGATPYDTLPNGIAFDTKSGTLTVKAGAAPTVLYLKATNAEGLSSKMKINIHGMSFSFGSDEPDAESGNTQVTNTQYTNTLGFGFETISGLTVAANNVGSTEAYKFKVKVPNGNYTVNVTTTSASMTSEIIDGVDAITGITKSGSSFNVAVCDGILDLTFLADSNVSELSVSQIASKSPLEKPAVYAIGDSTTKNGNSANSWGEVASQYLNTNVFTSFANHGKAGDDSVVYYNGGRVENVLLSVNPGDYVTINMGINSKTAGESASYDTLLRNYYIQGVIQRGAIPVILTHTPQGPVGNYAGNYDSANDEFNCARTGQHNGDLKQYAEDYNLNLIDVSKFANDYFNSLTYDDVANTELHGTHLSQWVEGKTVPTTRYELVASWCNDWNHYDRPLSDKIAQYILGKLENIVENPFDIASVTKTVANGTVTLTATTPDKATKGSKDLDVMVAQYDADGVLLGVEKSTVTFSSATDGLTATAEYTPVSNAASTKVFVWDSNLKPYLVDTTVTTTDSNPVD